MIACVDNLDLDTYQRDRVGGFLKKSKKNFLIFFFFRLFFYKLDPDTYRRDRLGGFKHMNRDAVTTLGKRCNPGKRCNQQINFGRDNSTKGTENWIALNRIDINLFVGNFCC